jgi:hypothetical protein
LENIKNILDIEDRQDTFKKISGKIGLLNKAFQALSMDYSYHIETTFGKNHKIFDLKKDIDYRLFSSKFHLELLFRQHLVIQNRIEEIYKTEPKKIIGEVYPSNPILDYCEKEISSILDSIIFHLASVYDYLSAIINFICNNKDESITKWSQLNRSCLDKRNAYNSKKIAKTITEQHNIFINKLYTHRSRLIHKTSDIHPISLDIKLKSGKTTVKFFATKELTKNFSELRQLSKTNNITVEYVAEWFIENTFKSLFKLMHSLKDEMESMSNFPNHVKDEEIVMFYRNPITGIGEPPSVPIWNSIKADINYSQQSTVVKNK